MRPELLVLALTAVGWALRVLALDSESLWFDTAHSGVIALNPALPDVLRAAAVDLQSPLYFVLLHYWLPVGLSDFWLRLPTAIAGALIIPLTYALGARLFSRQAGVIAALFCALTTYQVYYSRYPRSYILVALLALVAAYTLHRALENTKDAPRLRPATSDDDAIVARPSCPLPRWERARLALSAVEGVRVIPGTSLFFGKPAFWAAYGVSVALALYAHPYAVFSLLPVFGYAAWRCARGGRSWFPFIVASSAAVAAYLPWLAVSLAQLSAVRSGADSWMEPLTAGSLKTSYDWLWFMTRAEYGAAVDWLLRGARYLFTALVLLALWRWRRRPEVWFAAALAAGPVLGALAFSFTVVPVWDPRYLVVVSPFFGLLLGLALSEPWPLPVPGWTRGRRLDTGNGMRAPSVIARRRRWRGHVWWAPWQSGSGESEGQTATNLVERGPRPRRPSLVARRSSLVALLAIINLPPLGSLFADSAFAAPDIKGGVRWVHQRYREGDLILHVNYQSYLPALWYDHLDPPASGAASHAVPCVWASMPPAWCNASPWRTGYVDLELAPFDAAVRDERRVWLLVLYNHNWEGEEQRAARLAGDLAAGARFIAGDGARFSGVLVYELNAGG